MTLLEQLEQKAREGENRRVKISWIRRFLPRGISLHESGGVWFLQKGVTRLQVDIDQLEAEMIAVRRQS